VNEENPSNVSIKAKGNVAGVGVKGDRNITIGGDSYGDVLSGDIKTKTITIDKFYLDKMPKEYANSLQDFCKEINEQLEKEETVSDKKIEEVKGDLNEAAKEMAEVKPDEKGIVTIPKSNRMSIGSKFSAALEKLVDISPKIAETVSSCIPILSPFSKVIGESIEKLKEIRNKT
jgi:hypothetical protein